MASKKDLKNKLNYLPIIFGLILLAVGLFIPATIYFPVAKAEVIYQLKSNSQISFPSVEPVDRDFSIVIPKIGANTKVIKNIDPHNPKEYQLALTRGVAHALNSGLPNEQGNTFIFAHSAGNWYQANRYNAVFYLLNKLVEGDEIIVYYQNKDYHYFVTETKLVNGSEISYLRNTSFGHQLTLMTCWPPGTTLKRQIVIANLSP
ncbi:MAG: sortase [Candidatus Shapirobacteria bacterium]|jgi:sortase A